MAYLAHVLIRAFGPIRAFAIPNAQGPIAACRGLCNADRKCASTSGAPVLYRGRSVLYIKRTQRSETKPCDSAFTSHGEGGVVDPEIPLAPTTLMWTLTSSPARRSSSPRPGPTSSSHRQTSRPPRPRRNIPNLTSGVMAGPPGHDEHSTCANLCTGMHADRLGRVAYISASSRQSIESKQPTLVVLASLSRAATLNSVGESTLKFP